MKMNRKKKISLCIVIVLAIVGMLGLILLRIYNPENENSFFIPCFFYKIMGIKCPGCGMTRSLHNLVNGDIKKAIWYNVMSIPAIVLLIYIGYRYLMYLLKDEEILNEKMEMILKVFLVILIIFGISRNFTDLFY